MELISAGINPIKFPGLRVAVSSDESKMINFDKKPKVIISASVSYTHLDVYKRQRQESLRK